MPAIIHVWQLIQCGDYSFSTDLKAVYLHIPIVKYHHPILHFVWQHTPYQWKVLPFGLATSTGVLSALTYPILFLCWHKGYNIVIYLHDNLVLVHSKQVDKRAQLFLCSLLICLGLQNKFPSLTFISLRLFVPWGYVEILSICQYLCHLIS